MSDHVLRRTNGTGEWKWFTPDERGVDMYLPVRASDATLEKWGRTGAIQPNTKVLIGGAPRGGKVAVMGFGAPAWALEPEPPSEATIDTIMTESARLVAEQECAKRILGMPFFPLEHSKTILDMRAELEKCGQVFANLATQYMSTPDQKLVLDRIRVIGKLIANDRAST